MSKNAALRGFGGGSAVVLNLKVAGGLYAPTGPAENTIWVNTDTEISGWYFSATEPAEPAEGMVWLKTALSGRVGFNALKQNGIMIYLTSCSQYIGGAWVTKNVQIYSGGVWQTLDYWLITDGQSDRQLIAKALPFDSNNVDASAPTVSQDVDGIKITANGYGFGVVYMENVYLDNYNTLTLEGSFRVNSGVTRQFIIWSTVGNYIVSNRVKYATLTENGAVLDVSDLTGAHVVGINTILNGTDTITNLYLQ